jgi:DNA-directed RNA polymerase III subunit RPC11
MECRTCTYVYVFERDETFYEQKTMKAKEVEDVIGGAEAWDNAEKAATQCNRDDCDGDMAYFFQKQIRSADEPMTTFYKVGSSSQGIVL